MTPTEHPAKTARTANTGIFALRSSLLGFPGSGARSTNRARAVKIARALPVATPVLAALALLAALAFSAAPALAAEPSCAGLEEPARAQDESVRQRDNSSSLPDCRAYELVSAPHKNGGLIDSLFASSSEWGPLIAQDGKDVMAPDIQCFADAESCTSIREVEGEPYEFARSTQGWVTHAFAPPASQFGISTQHGADADTHTALFSAPAAPGADQDIFYIRTEDKPPVALGPLSEAGIGTPEAFRDLRVGNTPIASTSDFSHTLFQSISRSPLWSLDGFPEEAPTVYEYAATGESRPLAVGVSGPHESTKLISECETKIGDGSPNVAAGAYGAISEDGHIVYFTAEGHSECPNATPAPATDELFARIDGETQGEAHTVLVSAPVPSSCDAECQAAQSEPQDAEFEGASHDGSRVFFTSAQQLTDNASIGEGIDGGRAGKRCYRALGAGCNLYESVCGEPCGMPGEEPAAKERQLIDVSEEQGGGKAPGGGPRVQGVVAISADGSHVYFVARGELATNPGVTGTKAIEGENNLYVYERDTAHPEGRLTFIATLPASDENEFHADSALEWREGIQLANVTPDGRFLVFVSHAALTADDTTPERTTQIYRYDAQTATITRISIGEHGFNNNGNVGHAGEEPTDVEPAILPAFKGWRLAEGPGRANPTMSNDGEYVFFESPAALAPGALNEVVVSKLPVVSVYAENIYEWHNGEVFLISDGKDTTPNSAAAGINTSTALVGSDESGKNVFFDSNDQITPQDTDTDRDIYDARICETGEEVCVAPPVQAPACEGESCQGEPSTPPVLSTPTSTSFTTNSNLTPAPPPTVVKPTVKKVTKCRKGFVKNRKGRCVRRPKGKKRRR